MLRTDLFKTRDRETTSVIAVRDTLTEADPTIDATVIDEQHCLQGRFGIGYQFLITVTGDIQLCRGLYTIGAHSRDYDQISVGIGVVGGTVNKERMYTRTEEQEAALQDLIEVMLELWPLSQVHDIA